MSYVLKSDLKSVYTPELDEIQDLKVETLAKALGCPAWQLTAPKDTIPISTPLRTRGPPESPLQEPRPPAPEVQICCA